MKTLLKRVSYIATFDPEGRELRDADILVDGRFIGSIGRSLPEQGVDQVIDCRGMLALPGLINAHIHLWQAAARGVPELERGDFPAFLEWVVERPTRWWRDGRFGPDSLRALARAVLLECLLGGVTTVADQHLFFPEDPVEPEEPWVEATIEAASEVGVRFHACRGTATAAWPDDARGTKIEAILRHCQELIDRYHDPRPLAMVRVALAPSGVHRDVPRIFEEFAQLAQQHDGVRLHTHLYEKADTQVAWDQYGVSPWRFLATHGWASDRVWLAHVNDPPPSEIPEFARAGVGIVHVSSGELWVGWGLTPVRAFLDAGIPVGFGTTGASANGTAHLLGDLRVTLLVQRAGRLDREGWLSVRDVLSIATRGSAACLGRPDLGSLAPGMAADIACWDIMGVDRVGVHDPVIGLLQSGLCHRAEVVMVNGEVLVQGGKAVRMDEAEVGRVARRAVPMEE